MARTGRPPKPIEQKKREGTYRKDRDPSHGNLAVIAPIPVEMHELEPGDALEQILFAGVHWIATTDAVKVALLREAMEDYSKLRAAGASAKDVREARTEVSKMLGEMGFDPSSRARLGLAEVKAQSVMEDIRARSRAVATSPPVAGKPG